MRRSRAHISTVARYMLPLTQISGGTGITPFFQLLHQTMLAPQHASDERTRFTLLHSSRTPGELPPPAVLQPLLSHAAAHPNQLGVALYVDALDGSRSASVPTESLNEGRIGKAAVRRALNYGNEGSWWARLLRTGPAQPTQPAGKRTLVLVCGPEP